MRAGIQASDRDLDPDPGQNGVNVLTQLSIGIAIRIDLSGSQSENFVPCKWSISSLITILFIYLLHPRKYNVLGLG